MKTVDGVNWTTLTSGISESLNDVYFIDSNVGWAVGMNGSIIKTSDAGTTWLTQISGTNNELKSVHFIDTNVGWIVGGNTILKTTDSGISWVKHITNTDYWLNSVFFVSQNDGWAVGEEVQFSTQQTVALHLLKMKKIILLNQKNFHYNKTTLTRLIQLHLLVISYLLLVL